MTDWFRAVARRTSEIVGNAKTFILALLLILIWAVSGPIFGFSDTWQLVINTTTTIITFLMVFLIQNTQNRDSKQMNLKIDELIRASKSAKDRYIDLDSLTDEELLKMEDTFIRASHKRKIRKNPESEKMKKVA